MDYTWQYYDVVLLAIFGSMAVGAAVGTFTEVAVETAVIGAGVVALAVMGHALFVNGPGDDPGDLAQEVETLN